MNTCPACGQPVEDPGSGTCTHCGADLSGGGGAGGTGSGGGGAGGEGDPTTQPPGKSSVPFEDRTLPFSTRLFKTIGMAFSRPKDLFSEMPTENLGPPVLYAVIIGTIGGVFAAGWQLMFGSLAMMAERAGFEDLFLQTGFIIFFMVLSPVFALIGVFIHAGIYHIMLLLVGDGERGFSITLRSVAYGLTPGLLGIVPFCGGIIGGIWSMVLTIMGALYGHKTDGWRAVLAYFLPMIFCCGAAIAMLMLFGFLAGID